MMTKINLVLLGILVGLGGISYGLPQMVSKSKVTSVQKTKLAKTQPGIPAATTASSETTDQVGQSTQTASANTTKEQKFVDPVLITAPADRNAATQETTVEPNVATQAPPVPQPSILNDLEKKKEPVFENWANADFLPKDDETTYHSEENLDLEEQVTE